MRPKPNAFAAGPMLRDVAPAGPTVQAFILDMNHRTKGIMGPVGGGKTTGCIQEIDIISAVQPLCVDGLIRSKGVVMRGTFRELEKTVLSSWFEWFPKEMKCPITGTDMWDFQGGNDRPAVHTRRWKSERGIIESITEFIGIGNHRIEDITRGAMWTWAWLNEWDLLHEDVIDAVDQRIPRYPPKRLLIDPANNDPIPFVIGDFNAPDIENWTYKRFKTEAKPASYRLFTQPGGMDPAAENRQNLPRGYYENFLATKPEWWCHRFVHNKFGYSRVGKPVYGEFNEHKHVAARELLPVPGIKLRIGMDGGGSPAAIISQKLPIGQVRWLDEVWTIPITGPARFAKMLLEVLSQPKYQGCEIEMLVCDPSAIEGADTQAGELSWVQTVARALALPFEPHYTNDPGLRQDGVRELLQTDIDGRIPALWISPTCRRSVAGMAHGYKIEHVNRNPANPLQNKVLKNEYSHVVEAGEYVTGSYTTAQALIDRGAKVRQRLNAAVPGYAQQLRQQAAQNHSGNFDVFK